MKISKKTVTSSVEAGKKMLQGKSLAIIYNTIGFTEKINPLQEDSDFFSNQEIGEIFDALIFYGITLIPFNNEMEFVNSLLEKKIDVKKIIVWNLSRQGTDNNQKSMITSICDFQKIPYIGSSVYSMNLARHKLHFQKILKASKLCNIPTYSIEEFKHLKDISFKKFILKKCKGSASRGLSEKSSCISYFDMLNFIENENISTDYIIQEYTEGYEIEVPLFQINGEFIPVGISGISINNKKYLENEFMPEEMFESSYSFYDFEYFSIEELNCLNCDFIYSSAIKIANELELSDYCRIDFRVDSQFNLYCFDISSTPYVTKKSSPNFLYSLLGSNHSSLLLTILGAFSSNIDSH